MPLRDVAERVKVAILGAGVLGASTALALTRAGVEVTLIDRAGPGSGTSSRGAGLVSEALREPTGLRLVTRSLALLKEMSREGDENGHPLRLHVTGSTTLVPPHLLEQARALAKFHASEGVKVRELPPADLVGLPRHEGMHVDDVALALHYPEDGWALPRLYSEISAFVASMEGARLVRGDARVERTTATARVTVNGETSRYDAVVVAAGVWTRKLLQEAGLDAPLLAYRTQALRYSQPHAGHVPIIHDAVQGFYLRPGIPQHLVAGNGTTTTPENVDDWRADADPSFIAATLRRIHHRFPHLPKDARVSAWAGIDAATPDRLLLAGPHAEDGRVWVLAGGNGHGFMRAPAVGESIALMLQGKAPRVDMTAYAPARFSSGMGDFPIREGFSIEE